MIELLSHRVISLYIAVLVSISQVKMRIFVRFYVVSYLPAVVEESALRVKRKTSHFYRLFVHRKVPFILHLSGAQTLRTEWTSPRSRSRFMFVRVWFKVLIVSVMSSTVVSLFFAGAAIV